MRGLIGLCVVLALAPIAAAAQPAPKPPAVRAPAKPDSAKSDPATPPAPAAEAPPPPYERDLMRLAEVMGSLAFLSDLCREPGSGEWRAKMSALLQSEATAEARRDRLAGSYNRGYRAYAISYRACTDSARAALGQYVSEGANLSRLIANRYGGT